MLTVFYFGLRVSEVTAILGEDVADGQLRVERLRHSQTALQRIPEPKGSPEFDLRLTALAKEAGPQNRLFPLLATLRSIYEAILPAGWDPSL